MEKRYFHRDGRTVWIRLTASLVRDAAGVPVNFVSQIEDKADHLVAGPLPQILHRIGERRRRSGIKPRDPQIKDVFCLDASGHGLELVALALDGDVDGPAIVAPQT